MNFTPNIMSPYDIHTHIVHITGAAAMCRISRLLGFEKLLPATAVSIAPVAEDQKSHPDCLGCCLLVINILILVMTNGEYKKLYKCLLPSCPGMRKDRHLIKQNPGNNSKVSETPMLM